MIKIPANISANSHLFKRVPKEIASIETLIKKQEKVNKEILDQLKKFSQELNANMQNANIFGISNQISSIVSALDKSSHSLTALENLMDNLNVLNEKLLTIQKEKSDQIDVHTLDLINQYNMTSTKVLHKIEKNNSLINEVLSSPISITFKTNTSSKEPDSYDLEDFSKEISGNCTKINIEGSIISAKKAVKQTKPQKSEGPQIGKSKVIPCHTAEPKINAFQKFLLRKKSNEKNTLSSPELTKDILSQDEKKEEKRKSQKTEKIKNKNKTIRQDKQTLTSKVETKLEPKENTLIISEIEQKVFLPYTFKELDQLLSQNEDKYHSYQEVIEDLYTRPLKYYQNAPISRFKEAYKLVKEKEQGPLKQALDLAFEVSYNSNLHPAIITACKNSNELDVYLACLEYNELEDFHFFDIVFQVAPSISYKYNKDRILV